MQEQQTIMAVILHENTDQFSILLKNQMQKININKETIIGKEEADSLIENGHRIRQWDCAHLRVFSTKKDGILKAISDVKFLHLNILSLLDSNISSTEMLGRINASNMKQLYLGSNKIVGLSGLRKIESDKLSLLYILDNYILDAQCLSEINCAELFHIGIEPYLQNMHQVQNLSFLTKLMHKSSKSKRYQLWIRSMARINQRILLKSLNQKYFQKFVSIYTQGGKVIIKNIS